MKKLSARCSMVTLAVIAGASIAALRARTQTASAEPAARAQVMPSATVVNLFPTLPPTWTPMFTPPASATRTPRPTATLTPTTVPRARKPTVIGYSVAGRPLEVYRFGTGRVKRMIVAGLHGGYEWNTIALADQLLAHLTAHAELVPPDVTLYILHSLNPDGEARSRGPDGRANERGVDLNRNFPAGWQADYSRAGCWDLGPIHAGAGPASEPETQALMQFVWARRVDALISYHSAALGIFAGGQPPDAASLSLAEAAAGVSDYPYPHVDTGCQYTGQLIDWASSIGIAAVDI